MYKKEERYRITYISRKDGSTKMCYPRSAAQKDEQLAICREKGIAVKKVEKLYPFNTYKNQHNFMLISNICFNRMHDMQMGEIPWNEAEYDALEARKDMAERFFMAELPVAWVPYTDWKDMTEMATAAIMHRQDACIANGRPELVSMCAQ